jgi:Ran GTPase-activating protein (RanGAP) involved in mRNA processing and transport
MLWPLQLPRLLLLLMSLLLCCRCGHPPLTPPTPTQHIQLLDPSIHPGQFLVSLNLSKCSLGEAGGLAIAAALASGNLELRVLSLSFNNLGNKTAAAFGDLLESSHTLKELDLSWNQIKVSWG